MKVETDVSVRSNLAYTWYLHQPKGRIRGSYASKLDGESHDAPPEKP